MSLQRLANGEIMATNDSADNGINVQLLKAAIKFNAVVFGVVSGIFAAIALIVATQISLAMWGDNAGGYLGLLGVFLPGYTVTPVGTLFGAFWAFVFVGLAGSLTYWWYGRLLGKDIATYVEGKIGTTDPVLKPATLRLNGIALGISIGAVIGAVLFANTSLLVIRGTAESSTHAALLSNYLPGYTVSFVGGLIGALELFILVFISSVVLAAIYNKVVDIRQGKIS